jgi:hypothetical protein
MSAQMLMGVGFYSRAEAARLLKVSPTRLSRWINGYTYKLRKDGEAFLRRQKQPVVHVFLRRLTTFWLSRL